MRMCYSLSRCEEENVPSQAKLQTPGCSDKVILLKEAAAKAFETLQEGSCTFECTFESLQREVKEVYNTLEGVLSLAVQMGADEGLMEHIFKAPPDHCDLRGEMEFMYEKAHDLFMSQIIESVEAIHNAAAKALHSEDRAITVGAPWQHGGAAHATKAPSRKQQELSGVRTEAQVCLATCLAIRLPHLPNIRAISRD